MFMTITLLLSAVLCVVSFNKVRKYLSIAAKNRTYKKFGFTVYNPDPKDQKAKKKRVCVY